MITNDRQYRITKKQFTQMRQAAEEFNLELATVSVGSDILAKAEFEALQSEVEVLAEQIREYEALKSGAVTVLRAETLQELPRILIQARIAQGLSQREMADSLGIKEQQIQRYESEEYATASLRRLIEVAEALNLNISKVAELKPGVRPGSTMKSDEVDWSLFPVKEMYKRGWFSEIGFTGSMASAMADGANLVKAYVGQIMPDLQPAFLKHRARFGSKMNQHALWAWQCRILFLARVEQLTGSYSHDALTPEWLRALAKESRFDDGPLRAKKMLSEAGIPLIMEPHLTQTYLDGAAFLLPDSTPIIAMTLRFDRIDNFWFVLFHELIHVIKHLRIGELEDIFDDLEAEPDELEREADHWAGNALIPDEEWEVALARYVRTDESVISFGDEHQIHPAIAAGRIRKEADNYIIMSNLVGKGEVRKQFPEVKFGQ
jgi:HTH-type transcriptional regulator/antitoxin HigA